MIVRQKIDKIDYQNFIKQYLAACGVENVEAYLNPKSTNCLDDIWKYSNIDNAAILLDKHIQAKSKVCIVVDSDMDGACTAAVQYNFLNNFGIEPSLIYHTGKQHGLRDVLNDLLSQNPNLVWIGDAGSNDIAECSVLRENNIDVLITDHHIIEKENTYAIVVNNQIGNVNKCLSGCGVTYQVIRAYAKKYCVTIPDMFDLVAISIIGDVCSLLPLENRFIIHYGLNHPQNEFVKTLLTKCTRYGANPKGVAWEIAPLCNALARSDEQECKHLFVDALIGKTNPDAALKEMRRVKRTQDDLTKNIVDEMEEKLDKNHKSLIAFMSSDYKTLSGLIAGKICGKYNKPTFVLRELDSTTWCGSMRSNVDLLQQINQSKLAVCQGHEAACGITIKKSNLKKFAQWFDTLDLSQDTVYNVATIISNENLKTAIPMSLCENIIDNTMLWGKDIDEPLFCFRITNPTVSIFRKSTNTLRLEKDGVCFVKFRLTESECAEIEHLGDKTVEIVGRLTINEYNDIRTPQVIIEHYEIVDNQNEETFDFDTLFK